MRGWECSKCGSSNAPFVATCPRCSAAPMPAPPAPPTVPPLPPTTPFPFPSITCHGFRRPDADSFLSAA